MKSYNYMYTPQEAVKEDNTDEVQQQLAELPEDQTTTLLKARDEDGYTVMHHAAELNCAGVLKLLIMHGAGEFISTTE